MSAKKKIQIKRLKGRTAIDLLFKNGAVKKEPFIILKYLVEEESSFYYSGVAVPKRKIKKAVNRNKIKRLMREAVKNIDQESLFSGSGLLLYTGEKTPELGALTLAIHKLFKEVNSNP